MDYRWRIAMIKIEDKLVVLKGLRYLAWTCLRMDNLLVKKLARLWIGIMLFSMR
jgi:hypothetical protein